MTIREIADAFVEEYAQADPVRASRVMGIARDATHLTDYSPEGQDAIADVLRTTLREVEGVAPTDEAERLGRAHLEDSCRAQLALMDAGEMEGLVSGIAGPPSMVRMSFDVMADNGDADWERIAARLEAVPDAMAGYRASVAVRSTSDRVPPVRLVETVADQCATWAGSWFSAYVARYGDGALRDRLDRASVAAAAAYADLADWLRADVAPRATSIDGVGTERYRLWASYMLGTDLDLDDAYDWAVDDLARIEQEKAVECDRILPGASFEEVRAHLDADPTGCVEGADAFRAALQEVVDAAIDGLADVEFDIPAELRRCDVDIPPEGTTLAAYYSPPSEDLSQPATTWFPTGGAERFPMWELYTGAYHEAVPGHHLQIGLLRVLPLIRSHRLGGNTAHLEGWALYAEQLMDELGWFTTPASRLGYLCAQAFRAARVIVDVGLHTGRDGWTPERAVDLMDVSGSQGRGYAENEVLRYLSWPAQSPCYKLGQRHWLDGRAKAIAAQGASFDRKAWHSRALALGPLGLDRLDQELATLAEAAAPVLPPT